MSIHIPSVIAYTADMWTAARAVWPWLVIPPLAMTVSVGLEILTRGGKR